MMKEENKDIVPTFTITSRTVSFMAEISKKLTRLEYMPDMDLRMRRLMRLQTIQGMLAMDDVIVPLEQLAEVRDNKRMILTPNDAAMHNAIKAYRESDAKQWNALSVSKMGYAHEAFMSDGMVQYAPGMVGAGRVNTGGMFVRRDMDEDTLSYVFDGLLECIKTNDIHPLITACVFHYEMEYLHPFAQGNSRVGWLWQMLLLKSWNKLFAYLPVELMVYKDMEKYISVTNYSTQSEDCCHYIEFMLDKISAALNQLIFTLETDMNITPATRSKATPNAILEITSERILKALKENPEISRNILAELLERSPDLIKYHLQKLTKTGIIKHIGSTKGGRWEVYR